MFGTDDLACETFGQFLKPRHFSPIDKDRNHANSAAQRRLDLDPNGIEGSSRRRLFSASALESQPRPMTAISASHRPT
jgi:hypothetical protein